MMSKVLVTVLLVLMCASSLGAADDDKFNVDFFFGWGTYYRPMEWTPVEIRVQSDLTEAFAGRFTVSAAQDGLNTLNINHRFVVTPDTPEAFPLVTKLAFGQGHCDLTVRDERGRRWWEHSVDMWDRTSLRVVHETDLFIGTVGWPRFGLSSLHQKTACRSDRGEGQVCWGRKDMEMMPWDWTGFVSLDVLVLYDPDWTQFRNEQLKAVSQWVSNGGVLLLVLGQHPLPAASPLAQMIPFHIGEPRQVEVPTEALDRWGLEATTSETVTAWPMFSRPEATLTDEVRLDQGGFLYGLGRVGFGRVAVLAFDPEELSKGQRALSAQFWTKHVAACLQDESLERSKLNSRIPRGAQSGAGIERTIVLLDEDASEDQRRRNQYDNRYEISIAESAGNRVMEHLYQLKQMEPLSIWWVILTLAALAVLLGPVDYLVLKRLDRLPYTWLTSTMWIVIFTVGAYFGVQALRGGNMQLRAISVVDGMADGSAMWRTHYMGLFSPRSADYRLTGVGDRQWWSGIAPTQDVIHAYQHQAATRQIHCLQEDGASYPLSVPINIWTVQTLLNESPVEEMPFAAAVELQGGGIGVEISNTSDYEITGGYVLVEDGCAELGPVPARSTQRFDRPKRPFNPWGGDQMRRSQYHGRTRSVPFAMPEYQSVLGPITSAAFLAQGCLDRTIAAYEYLHLGGAMVCVEYAGVPAPFGVEDRSYEVNHVQLARLIVFPRDGG